MRPSDQLVQFPHFQMNNQVQKSYIILPKLQRDEWQTQMKRPSLLILSSLFFQLYQSATMVRKKKWNKQWQMWENSQQNLRNKTSKHLTTTEQGLGLRALYHQCVT